jgi:hypothetical protein
VFHMNQIVVFSQQITDFYSRRRALAPSNLPIKEGYGSILVRNTLVVVRFIL